MKIIKLQKFLFFVIYPKTMCMFPHLKTAPKNFEKQCGKLLFLELVFNFPPKQ